MITKTECSASDSDGKTYVNIAVFVRDGHLAITINGITTNFPLSFSSSSPRNDASTTIYLLKEAVDGLSVI